MAITSNNTFVSGDVLTAQECNNFPFGVVGAVTSTAGNLTVGAAQADLTGATITFTAIANRTYKFNVMAMGYSALSAQNFIYLVVTNSSNTVFASTYGNVPVNGYTNLSFSNFVTGLSAGSNTFKLRAQCATPSAEILRSGNDALSFWIEDIGTA